MERALRTPLMLLTLLGFAAPAFAQVFEPIRINSGGDDYADAAGNLWNADQASGLTASVGTPITGTDDPALFQSLRYSASPVLGYVFAVPNGTYRVRAMFAELWGGAFAPGVRRFHVAAEGQMFFPDVDVFAEVGGFAALEKTFNVTVTDGALNLEFVQGVQNPIVNAIEVTSTAGPGTPSDLSVQGATGSRVDLGWNAAGDDVAVVGYEVERCAGIGCNQFELAGTTTEAAFSDSDRAPSTRYRYRVRSVDAEGNYSPYSAVVDANTRSEDANATILRVNAGGEAYTDSAANHWEADAGFNAGSAGTVGQTIDGTNDPLLYRSLRWNTGTNPELEYSFPIVNGRYGVRLHFAEIYYGAFYVGGRVFNVEVEGVTALQNLDVFAEAGANTALVKTVTTTVTDGQLNIRFVHGTAEHPFVSAIEVVALPDEPPPPPPPPPPPGDTTPPDMVAGLSATAVSATEISLVWSEATDDVGVTEYSVERCVGSGCSDFSELMTWNGSTLNDGGLVASTSYSYRVRARDAAGNLGQYSPVAEATTLNPPVEEPPPPDDPPPPEDPPPPVEEPPPPVEEPPPPVEEPPPPVEEPPPPVEEPPPPVEEPPPPAEEPPPPPEEPPVGEEPRPIYQP